MDNVISRKKLEALVWRHTHRNFKGQLPDGTKAVLKIVPGFGTCLVTLASLSDAELLDQLPSKIRAEIGA